MLALTYTQWYTMLPVSHLIKVNRRFNWYFHQIQVIHLVVLCLILRVQHMHWIGEWQIWRCRVKIDSNNLKCYILSDVIDESWLGFKYSIDGEGEISKPK